MNVLVTPHAITQARTRRHFRGLRENELVDRITLEVRDAIANRREQNAKPPWTRLGGLMPAHQRKASWIPCRDGSTCVWNAAETLAWIIARDGDTVAVITALHRVNAQEAA